MAAGSGGWRADALRLASVGHAAARKRSVEMEITLPNGAAAAVRVPNGEGAVITLPDRRRYGFVPTLPKDADTPITVTIWDIQHNPPDPMGRVEIPVTAVKVQSETAPSFGIRIVRVITPK